MKKNIKTKTNFSNLTLFILILISYIFYEKFIYLAPNLNISISMLIYPITFLITANILKKYGITETKKTIKLTSLSLIIFIIISCILCSVESITTTNIISNNLREILTPNNIAFNNIIIYYPKILFTSIFIIVFTLSHYIFTILYEIINNNSNYIIAFLLSFIIAFLLDRIIFIPIVNINNLLNNTINIIDLIKSLTANFIIVIFSSVILLFIHYFYQKRK